MSQGASFKKAIRLGDHSPENFIICGGLRNRATKNGGNRDRVIEKRKGEILIPKKEEK